MQAIDLKAWIVAANEIEKLVELFRPETVVDAGRPFDVGSELAAPANVDGGVEAEPGAVRHGIDVPLEWRASRQRIVLPLGIVGLRRPIAVGKVECARQPRGMQSGRQHQLVAANSARRLTSRAETEHVLVSRDALDRTTQNDGTAVGLDMAFERQHEGMAVDDAGRG